MQFGIVQQEMFDAVDGSYSLVTDRELYDSQITATDAETNLLSRYFLLRGEKIHVGNVSSNRVAAAKEFRLYPSGKVINLNLVYPKPQRGELRLYLSKSAGFFPAKGDVWFLFVSKADNTLWIGAMPEKEWRRKNSIGKADDDLIGDSLNVEAIDAEIAAGKTAEEIITKVERKNSRQDIVRRREFAFERMRQAKFKCEFDVKHKLFIAKATGCNYLESHHIIPIRFQPQLHHLKLDSLNNLCCLCPYCHRAIHHAENEVVKEILTRVAEIRNIKGNFGISTNDLYRLYAVEDITRE